MCRPNASVVVLLMHIQFIQRVVFTFSFLISKRQVVNFLVIFLAFYFNIFVLHQPLLALSLARARSLTLFLCLRQNLK